MKASELTKDNIGDTIMVRGAVCTINSSVYPVRFAPNNVEGVWLYKDTEVEIVERSFKVDDKVLWKDHSCTIRAIDGEYAWVWRYHDQARFTVKTSDLKRAAP